LSLNAGRVRQILCSISGVVQDDHHVTVPCRSFLIRVSYCTYQRLGYLYTQQVTSKPCAVASLCRQKTTRSLAAIAFVGWRPLALSCTLCPHGGFVLYMLSCAASFGKRFGLRLIEDHNSTCYGNLQGATKFSLVHLGLSIHWTQKGLPFWHGCITLHHDPRLRMLL
jgi:hypothetical protein